MDLKLEGKRALVTGSTAGIGLAIADKLAGEGAVVLINGRSQERVKEAIGSIREEKENASLEGIVADLSDAWGAQKVIQEAGEIDILVNNVGIFEQKPFEEIPDEDWLRFFETNVMSGVRLTRHYLPRMKEKNWGRILFISSESGVQIPTEMIHYGVTKTAQLAVSRGVAELTRGTEVTVNSILPGPTASEGVNEWLEQLAEKEGITVEEAGRKFVQEERPTSILGRPATTEEVANLVAYVASPLSLATNGASLRVDGGVVRSII